MNITEKRPFFIGKRHMEDFITNRKRANSLKVLKQTLNENEYKEFTADFHKKVTYEMEPALQISTDWLETIFGFKGEMQINILSHGTDARYTNGIKEVCIELKMFSTMQLGLNLNGSQKTSQYHNGQNYWDLTSKAWKFRTDGENFTDDCSFVMIIDSETDDLVEAIYVPKSNMKILLDAAKVNKEGHRHLAYTHVKDFNHMNGCKIPVDPNQELFEYARTTGIVYKRTPKGSYFSDYANLSIGKTQVEVVDWILGIKDFDENVNKMFNDFIELGC